MFGINQLQAPVPPKPVNTLGAVSAGVSVSTGLLTLVVVAGIAYLIWK